jgi:predicted nucleotidyltransferase
VLDALRKENVDYVLIGGFAIVLHGSTRFTEDLDIFVRTSDDNIDKLRKALYSVFQDENVKEITGSEIRDYAVIRYGATEDFYIDIIGKLGDAFSFEDISYKEIDIEGTKIKLATLETLYKLKEKTFRAIDQNDLLFLSEKIRNKNKGNDKEI